MDFTTYLALSAMSTAVVAGLWYRKHKDKGNAVASEVASEVSGASAKAVADAEAAYKAKFPSK